MNINQIAFRTGTVTAPQINDPSFTDEAAARAAVIAQSRDDSTTVFALWTQETGEVVAIYHEGIEYRPA